MTILLLRAKPSLAGLGLPSNPVSIWVANSSADPAKPPAWFVPDDSVVVKSPATATPPIP